MGVDLKNQQGCANNGAATGAADAAKTQAAVGSGLRDQGGIDATRVEEFKSSKMRMFASGTSFRFEATGTITDPSDPAGAVRRLQRFARGLPFNFDEEVQLEGSVWVLFVEVEPSTGRFEEALTQLQLRDFPSVLAALSAASGGVASQGVQPSDLVRRVVLFQWALVALYFQKPSFLVGFFPGPRRDEGQGPK